ncbi:ABC transporter ATP-binding protein [Myxococcus sp. K15C18031901]|uniref:ABC transporter ATP-binding protein n=1 Tax=Myxococcus dinghuensis TaxID=2906761 RepID=UPI0020A77809|nr:ABC transporter ATP-binding protein [Myxococcus dinghuensis]MCP3105262.1 ABC transporter ATP-binding protein [Myxococcus dinghuensis]
MTQPAIQLTDIVRDYQLGKTTVHAARGVSLEFQRGEFTALAGASGSGKTTLLNIIGCIDKPDAGRVRVDGQDVTDTPLHRLAGLRNRYFGFVFQTFNLVAVLDAYENVELPLVLGGVPARQRRERVEALLESVGLANHRHHRPQELSGGQRQRVAIARALVTEPLAVLADEPTANLDSKTGADILELMAALNASRGVTFIFSTHDHHIINRAARVIWLSDGTVREVPPAERAAAPSFRAAGVNS